MAPDGSRGPASRAARSQPRPMAPIEPPSLLPSDDHFTIQDETKSVPPRRCTKDVRWRNGAVRVSQGVVKGVVNAPRRHPVLLLARIILIPLASLACGERTMKLTTKVNVPAEYRVANLN